PGGPCSTESSPAGRVRLTSAQPGWPPNDLVSPSTRTSMPTPELLLSLCPGHRAADRRCYTAVTNRPVSDASPRRMVRAGGRSYRSGTTAAGAADRKETFVHDRTGCGARRARGTGRSGRDGGPARADPAGRRAVLPRAPRPGRRPVHHRRRRRPGGLHRGPARAAPVPGRGPAVLRVRVRHRRTQGGRRPAGRGAPLGGRADRYRAGPPRRRSRPRAAGARRRRGPTAVPRLEKPVRRAPRDRRAAGGRRAVRRGGRRCAGHVGGGGPGRPVPRARAPAYAGTERVQRGAGMTDRTPSPPEQPVDPDVLWTDDLPPDALGRGGQAPADDAIAALLAAWRADLADPADPPAVAADEPADPPAVAEVVPITRARQRRRVRLGVAAAVLAVIAGGTGIAAAQATHGSPLWPITQLVNPQRAAVLDAESAIEAARQAV